MTSLAAIRCLVSECKANVEAGDKTGETPLHRAAVFDKAAAIRCLVSECKANVEAGDEYGRTPLHRVDFVGGAYCERWRTKRLLRKLGAKTRRVGCCRSLICPFT